MSLALKDLRVETGYDRHNTSKTTRPATVADLIEALSADPDTLTITKVDGEWPAEAVKAFMADQRSKDWVDFHPEAFCHRCGRPNIHCWFVASREWNLAVRVYEDGEHVGTVEGYPDSEIICPQCFVDAWNQKIGVESSCWELRIDPLTDPRGELLDALLEGQPK